MRKTLILLLLLSLLLLLAACGHPFQKEWTGPVTAETIAALEEYPALQRADLRGSDCPAAIAAYREAHPEVMVLADLEVGGSRVRDDAKKLSLRPGEWTAEALCAAAPWLRSLRELSFPGQALPPEEIAALRAAFPGAALETEVTIGGGSAPIDAEALSLQPGAWTLEGLCAAAPCLSRLETLDFGETPLSPEELSALRGAFPEAQLQAPIAALDRVFSGGETELDLSAVDPARLDEIRALLPWLPALERIETVPAEGESAWTLEALSELRAAAPENAAIACRFELFGQTLSSEDEEIVYYRNKLGDDKLPIIRMALPLLSGCRRFVLDDCDLDYAKLAELRDEFPERNLVWRVRFGIDSVLTDTQRIWSVFVTDENCDVLKYCTEVLYLDVGHEVELNDFHYIPYMTKLQVLIVMRTGFSDCELLTHCPDLEYLEIFSSNVTDLSPLAECHNLEHLNISNLPEVTDISPLYGLTKLKRLRITMDSVPAEQKEEIARRLPDCELLLEGYGPTDNGWRRNRQNELVPRYALLREQMGYDGHASPVEFVNFPEMEALGYTKESVFTRS